MTIYFTSDPHFFHKNVIRSCDRPFTSLEEMHEELIKRYNSVVKPEDSCYFLGDFAFCGVTRMKEIVDQLNGTIYLVPGNHDQKKTRMEKAGFIVLEAQETLYFAGRKFTLCHFPYTPTAWDTFRYKLKHFWKFWRRQKYNQLRYMDRRPVNDGRWLLHGHTHSKKKVNGNQIHVGVDAWKFRPVSIREICQIVVEEEAKRKGRPYV
jgi:calcineurin-like phosphoesterase family protein